MYLFILKYNLKLSQKDIDLIFKVQIR